MAKIQNTCAQSKSWVMIGNKATKYTGSYFIVLNVSSFGPLCSWGVTHKHMLLSLPVYEFYHVLLYVIFICGYMADYVTNVVISQFLISEVKLLATPLKLVDRLERSWEHTI